MLRLLTLYFSIIFLLGCSSKSKSDYVEWVEDYKNKLHVSKNVNEYLFDVQYQPVQYLQVSKESSQENQGSIQHYRLSIDVEGSDQSLEQYNSLSIEDIQRRLYYLSYRFQYDIYLEEKGKKIPCALFHFERSADLKKERTFLLGFENPSPESKEATLVIHSDWFDSLPIKIKVSKENPASLYL